MVKEIQANTFMNLFVAISYTHEQRYFNLSTLSGYLWQKFIAEDEVINEIEDITDKMVDDKILIPIEGYDELYQISNGINYMKTIKDNIEYLDDMKNFFYSYYNNSDANILISNSIQK